MAQWTYDAYGAALTAEHLAAHPLVHLGHKGLFFDRLDVGVVSTLGTELPRLVPFAHLVVQMRNRAYLPGLGRFLQRDPNATAMALIEASAMHGRGLGAIGLAFDMQAMYGDGASLYQYVRSSPWSGSDPLGLFSEAIDAYATMGLTAGRLAYMLTSTYADNLEHDVEWAGDIRSPDDWHTRGDASWIDDIYREVDINGAVDSFVDPLPMHELTITGISDWRKAARLANKGGMIGHHVISWYKATAARFNDLKNRHGFEFDLWDVSNMLPMPPKDHGAGRHRKVYHDRVFELLTGKLVGKYGEEAATAFRLGLHELKGLIAQNPNKWFKP